MVNAPPADLRGEHRAQTGSTRTARFVADIDAAFEPQILDLP
jgi:hypothetical protein